MTTSYDGGLRPLRVEFVRETTEGVTPADPSWQYYADDVRVIEPSPSPQTAAREGLGTPDTAASHAGTEQTSVTVEYDMQQWLVDGSGNALDALYDGIARDADNKLPNSHTMVRRIKQSGLEASNTVNGSTSKDSRQYFVGKGGKIADWTVTADPTDGGSVIQVTLEYQFEKGRFYKIDQPGSAKQVALKSTDSGDTGVTVTIQGTDSSDAAAEEDVALDGTDATTAVDSDTEFKAIDAIEIGSEMTGDLEVYEDDDATVDTVTVGDQLAVFYGAAAYDQGEGDLGVPALGAGSHASAVGTDYELFIDGDTVTAGGTSLGDEIAMFEASGSNNLSSTGRAETPRPALSTNGRDVEVSGTVYGEEEQYRHTVEMLLNNDNDVKWTAKDASGSTGDITWAGMDTTDVSGPDNPNQSPKEVDVTMANQTGVTIN